MLLLRISESFSFLALPPYRPEKPRRPSQLIHLPPWRSCSLSSTFELCFGGSIVFNYLRGRSVVPIVPPLACSKPEAFAEFGFGPPELLHPTLPSSRAAQHESRPIHTAPICAAAPPGRTDARSPRSLSLGREGHSCSSSPSTTSRACRLPRRTRLLSASRSQSSSSSLRRCSGREQRICHQRTASVGGRCAEPSDGYRQGINE